MLIQFKNEDEMFLIWRLYSELRTLHKFYNFLDKPAEFQNMYHIRGTGKYIQIMQLHLVIQSNNLKKMNSCAWKFE